MHKGLRWLGTATLHLVLASVAVSAQEVGTATLRDSLPPSVAPLLDEYRNLTEMGLYPQALAQIVSLRRQVEQELELTDPAVLKVNILVAQTYGMLKRVRDAENVFASLSARLDKAALGRSDRQLLVLGALRDFYKDLGDATKARGVDERLKSLRDALIADRYRPRFERVSQLEAAGQRDEAIVQGRLNAQDAEKELGASHTVTLQARSIVADLLARKKADEDRAREEERTRLEAERQKLEEERQQLEAQRALSEQPTETTKGGEEAAQGKVQP